MSRVSAARSPRAACPFPITASASALARMTTPIASVVDIGLSTGCYQPHAATKCGVPLGLLETAQSWQLVRGNWWLGQATSRRGGVHTSRNREEGPGQVCRPVSQSIAPERGQKAPCLPGNRLAAAAFTEALNGPTEMTKGDRHRPPKFPSWQNVRRH